MRFWRRRICPSTTPASRRPRRRPTTFIGGRRVAPRSIACCSSRRRACCPMTGCSVSTRGVFRSRGRAARRRLGARCWCGRTRAGAIEIRYRDRLMQWTEIAAGAGAADGGAAGAGHRAPPPGASAALGRSPVASGVQDYAAGATLAIDRRAWARRPSREEPVEADAAVDAQNAPTAAWKTADVFHSSHRRSCSQGDISISLRMGTFLFRFDNHCVRA